MISNLGKIIKTVKLGYTKLGFNQNPLIMSKFNYLVGLEYFMVIFSWLLLVIQNYSILNYSITRIFIFNCPGYPGDSNSRLGQVRLVKVRIGDFSKERPSMLKRRDQLILKERQPKDQPSLVHKAPFNLITNNVITLLILSQLTLLHLIYFFNQALALSAIENNNKNSFFLTQLNFFLMNF